MAVSGRRSIGLIFTVCMAASLSACGGGDSGTSASETSGSSGTAVVSGTITTPATTPATTTTDTKTSTVDSVSIDGSPATTAVTGTAYRFEPTAADTAGAALTFSVQNLPSWAKFDATTGTLTGSPAAGDVGKSGQITISASNGTESATLASFVITVTASTSITADLSWVAPSGSAEANLAGYRVYYGPSASSMTHVVEVDNAATTTYQVAELTHGTWYFAVTAYNADKVESSLSAVVPVNL